MRKDGKEGQLASYMFFMKKYFKMKVVQFFGAIRTDRQVKIWAFFTGNPRMFAEYSLPNSPTAKTKKEIKK